MSPFSIFKSGSGLKNFFVILFLNYFFVFGYGEVSRLWSPAGGTSAYLNFFEFPLVVALYYLLYMPCKKSSGEKIYTLFPLFLVYFFFDMVFIYLEGVPRLSDYRDLSILLDVYPFMASGIVIYHLVVAGIIVWLLLRWLRCKEISTRRKIISLIARVAGVVLLVLFLSCDASYSFMKKGLKIVNWSDEMNVRRNGRLQCLFIIRKEEKC